MSGPGFGEIDEYGTSCMLAYMDGVATEGNFHVGAKNEYSVSSEFIFVVLLLQHK
jgi:hypothetical protein